MTSNKEDRLMEIQAALQTAIMRTVTDTLYHMDASVEETREVCTDIHMDVIETFHHGVGVHMEFRKHMSPRSTF